MKLKLNLHSHSKTWAVIAHLKQKIKQSMINYRLNRKIPVLQRCSYEEIKWHMQLHIWIQYVQ
jgi:hypothetical protein